MQVIQTLTLRRSSHLFVVEDEEREGEEEEEERDPFEPQVKKHPKPLAVISAGDIIRCIYPHCE